MVSPHQAHRAFSEYSVGQQHKPGICKYTDALSGYQHLDLLNEIPVHVVLSVQFSRVYEYD